MNPQADWDSGSPSTTTTPHGFESRIQQQQQQQQQPFQVQLKILWILSLVIMIVCTLEIILSWTLPQMIVPNSVAFTIVAILTLLLSVASIYSITSANQQFVNQLVK